jgi:hypothetical protein
MVFSVVLAMLNGGSLVRSGSAMSLDDRIVHIPAVHATVSTGQGVANGTIKVHKVILDHQALAA